jgi:hypothetical protein
MQTERIREAVAVFEEPAALEEAVSELQSRGIDRADLSVLAPEQAGDASGRQARSADKAPPREAMTSDTDLRQGRVLGTSIAATIAGLLAAGITVATGGVAAAVIAATAASAGGVGLASTLIGRDLAADHASFLDAQLAAGGVLLWVHIRDPAVEQTVLDVLRRHSTRVSVHDHTRK